MKLSELKSFLNGFITANDLKINIQDEIAEYYRGSREGGRSMPIILKEDIELLVTKESLTRLCQSYSDGNLVEIELNYIADALLLSEFVVCSNNRIYELLQQLTDHEIYKRLTIEDIRKIIEQLNYE